MSSNNTKYLIDTAENKKFLEEVRNTLFSFGHQFPSPGGGSYYLGDDGTPWKERSRETWITSRMAHVYSMASFLGHEGSEALADAALKGLMGELHDEENGGWYAGLTADGEVLPNKQCYAHAFVILAASSAVIAGRPGAKELLEEALALYDARFWNEEEGLSCDTWNTEFTVLDEYRGLNANMHTVEAFLAAADVTGDEKYRVRAGRIIDNVSVWAIDNHYRIPEHFSSKWVPDLECNKEKPDDQFKPYGATPGHGLEWSRLITQWAMSTYASKEEASKYIDLAENLYGRAVADAWNADGAPGVVYTTDWEGKPIVHDRMHWTLAEAINAAAVLYRVTGKQKYADNYAEFMQYLDEKVLDHVNGSWFHQLNEKNEVIGTVWPGKSDLYHAVQATLIPYYAVELSIAPAIKAEKGVLMMKYDVVALGELLIDFASMSQDSAGYPTMKANPGGAPGNFLAALTKYGAKTAFIGKVGEDAFGQLLLKTMQEAGIETKGIVVDPNVFTTLAFVTFDETGDRSFSFARKPGADTCLSFEEIDLSLIDESKIFHFGTLSLTDEPVRTATKKAVTYAKLMGKTITFDPNLRKPLWKSEEEAKEQILWGLKQTDFVKISDEEVEFLWNCSVEEAADKLLNEYGIKLALITCGAEGAWLFNKSAKAFAECPKVKPVDTTGAGDICGGSAVTKLLRIGKDLESLNEAELYEAVKFAVTAASLSTEKTGGIPSIPEEETVLRTVGL